jgi:uncharacterized protein
MDNPIQVDLGRIAQDLQIRRVQVESVVQLLDEGNTVAFITRYRKERTGNLNEVTIREIQLRVQRLRELAERKETILKAIEGQGKLNPDLEAAIRAAENSKRLEDLYLPFKPKKRTKASDARERGLEPLAFRIWTRDEALVDLSAAAAEFINPEKGVESVEAVLEGVGHILAEAISEMAAVRDAVRKVVWRTGKIVTRKAEIPDGQGLEYRDYFDYSEPIAQIPPHRVLAINRGDKEGPLKVQLDVSRPDVEEALCAQLPLEGHPHAEMFRSAAIDALDRLILPSMEREVRRDVTEAAEKHAVDVFARNLRSLLLQPPIAKQVVMAIDPGFRTGCKVAVLDSGGILLDHGVIYPHPPQNKRSEGKVFIKDLVGKHKVGVLAIGNGTACRETEELVAEIISEGTRFSSEVGAAFGSPAPRVADGDPEQATAAPSEVAQPEGAAESATGEPIAPACEVTGSSPGAQEQQAYLLQGDQAAGGEGPRLEGDSSLLAAELGATAGPADGGTLAPDPDARPEAAAPVEALPPISGGAPESSLPEAEIEPAPPVSTDEGAAAATMNGGNHEDDGREAQAATCSAQVNAPDVSCAMAPDKPDVRPAATLEQPAAVEEDIAAPDLQAEGGQPPADFEASTVEAEAAPAHGSPVEEPAANLEPAASAAASTAPSEAGAGLGAPAVAAAPGAVPAPLASRQPRSPGQGKSEPRPRPPRTKHPPSPPSPPQPHPADAVIARLVYVVVNEAGASVYSTSQVGREELPDCDATLRSGISIGRRLQDPLSELVKIEPQNIGVGLYQHDVNPKHLKESLEAVIASCVNFVGVDLNTASVPLLRHVSGLNQLTARRILEFRKQHGSFSSRDQLMQVEGIGPATYTQAAGFLKIPESENPLDRTWIHPESYPVAVKLLERLGFAPEVVRDKILLPELCAKLAEVNIGDLARELDVGELTLRDIIDALKRPERDPREDLPKPIFKKGVLKLEDLSTGMELKGTVLNVVDFGAFVDIGLKDSGLVHISQLANRYVKSPHDVVSVGDVVTVWVMGVDHERKRVSLTMVKPGSERQRGAPSGPARRGSGSGEDKERHGRGSGPSRRGSSQRAPRPTGSALTSPPVGAPSVAVLADAPARRLERERGGPPGTAGPRSHQPHGAPEGNDPPPPGPAPRHARGPGSAGAHPRSSGPRSYQQGQGPGRPPRHDRGTSPRPSRAARPSPPPPPLSKDALAGNIPLRTFGQLKQLWEARSEGPPESPGAPPPYAEASLDHQLPIAELPQHAAEPTDSSLNSAQDSDSQANSNSP